MTDSYRNNPSLPIRPGNPVSAHFTSCLLHLLSAMITYDGDKGEVSLLLFIDSHR